MQGSHCDCHPRVRTLSTCAPCMNNSNQWQVKTDARNRLDWRKAQMCQHVLTTGFHGRFSSRSPTDPLSLCAIYILWMLLDLLVRGNWLPSCSDNRMQIVPVQHPQIVGELPGIANTYQTHGKAGALWIEARWNQKASSGAPRTQIWFANRCQKGTFKSTPSGLQRAHAADSRQTKIHHDLL